ncbi:hypothetical protein HYDPIDRAFT_114013 [Hydnomerulius pinastri MD-312]|uniref:Uncharacterized protein n=1 Tax=Hydnomerulius pinastri MD-312 TaxID=994086 RepID=A0A0C9VB49_9AGAM|nr:hypothetical protein HYDPIDRAFT_114013 [Hydnomerulius pinastri MD-312]
MSAVRSGKRLLPAAKKPSLSDFHLLFASFRVTHSSRSFKSCPFGSVSMVKPDSNNQHTPGRFRAFWIGFARFIGKFFKKSPSIAADLPVPVTARPPRVHLSTNPVITRPSSTLVKATHHRFSMPRADWGREMKLLKHRATASAVSSRYPSMARISPTRQSQSGTPKPAQGSPSNMLPPPASPFPNISLSGIFATPPTLASPCLASDIELGRLSLISPPQAAALSPTFSPGSPPPLRIVPLGINGTPRSNGSQSIHSDHSRSFYTPMTPCSPIMFRLDRSTISPTTMSDGSMEIISLGDRRGFAGAPLKVADIERLPSPWSPSDKTASFDVWMTTEGILMKATGPVANDIAQSIDDSAALRSAILSSLAASKLSDDSLSSASSGLDISVFINLDGMDDDLSGEATKLDVAAKVDFPLKAREASENVVPSVTYVSETPRRKRDTVLSITKFQTPVKYQASPRALKYVSTPLSKYENVDHSHLRTPNSISSTTYELRIGLFGEGRSMTAIENIISLLDQASPEPAMPAPRFAADSEDTAVTAGVEAF